MPKASQGIRIIRGALDEVAIKDRGNQIILRGVVAPESLALLRVDDYQREPLALAALSKMWQALKEGESLPDIELACRSQNFESMPKEGEFLLPADRVFIIDGQQRRNAALHILSIMEGLDVRIGAMIHFGTTKEWERERFRILNLERSKVSANVLLRNMRHDSPAVLTLYGLTFNESSFALFERVCWKQSQGVNDLISARTLSTVVGILHSHRSPAFRNSLGELVPALDRQAAYVKLDQWRKNIALFFQMLDECWGVRKAASRELSLHMRAGFLIQLVRVISEHTNFWRGDNERELYIAPEWRKRIATLPIHEPMVVQLISASGTGYGAGHGTTVLYSLIRDHLNKGLSNNRLRNREDERAANSGKTYGELDAAGRSTGHDDADDEISDGLRG